MEKVFGCLHTAFGTFQRPNDGNVYAAGDVITTSTTTPVIMSIPGASRDAGTIAGASGGQGVAPGIIASAILVDSANQATKLDSELWLFDTTITMDNDNAVFTPTDAECLTLVGVIPFPLANWRIGDATAGAGGNVINEVDNLCIPFNAINGNTLFGVLVARNAYTPVALETFSVRLKVFD